MNDLNNVNYRGTSLEKYLETRIILHLLLFILSVHACMRCYKVVRMHRSYTNPARNSIIFLTYKFT